jgi:hypothetical protein
LLLLGVLEARNLPSGLVRLDAAASLIFAKVLAFGTFAPFTVLLTLAPTS